MTPRHGADQIPPHHAGLARRLASDTGWLLAGGTTEHALALALQVVVARALGPSPLGLYALAMSAVTVLSRISMSGMQSTMLRYVAVYAAQRDLPRLKGTLLITVGLGTAIATALAVVLAAGAPWIAAAAFRDPALGAVLRYIAPALPLGVLITLLATLARALQTVRPRVVVENLLQPLASLALAAVAFGLGLGLTGVLIAVVSATAIAALVMLVWVARLLPPGTRSVRPIVDARTVLGFSLVHQGSTILHQLTSRADRVMLAALASMRELGLYSAAASLALQVNFLLYPVTTAFAPLVAPLHAEGRLDDLGRLYRQTTHWLLLVTTPVAIGLVTFAPEVIDLFGERFRGSATVLAILAPGVFIDAATGPVSVLLTLTGHQVAVLWTTGLMLVVTVGLNALLIPRYGAVGAALAASVTIAAVNAIRVGLAWRRVGIPPYERRSLLPLGLGAVAWAVSRGADALDVPWWGQAAVFAATYAVGAGRLGGRELIRQMVRRPRAAGRGARPVASIDVGAD